MVFVLPVALVLQEVVQEVRKWHDCSSGRFSREREDSTFNYFIQSEFETLVLAYLHTELHLQWWSPCYLPQSSALLENSKLQKSPAISLNQVSGPLGVNIWKPCHPVSSMARKDRRIQQASGPCVIFKLILRYPI